MTPDASPAALSDGKRRLLFATCFIALIATSFGFMVRVMLLDDVWKPMFNLTETEKGEIFGVGLWPFAISIVLFSLVIDKIGYKVTLWFAVICHIIQAVMLMTPGCSWVPESMQGYWWLWIGTFIGALGNGTVEAVINPVIATIYNKNKTLWLTLLHAGWPGGLVLAGLLALSIGPGGLDLAWEVQVAVLLFPVVIYGAMLISTAFPVNERVAAGIPYMTMLRQAGVVGALIVIGLILMEVGRVFGFEPGITRFWILALVMIFGFHVGGALGRGLFIILLLLMIPLATTELGTDAWIKDLLGPALGNLGLPGVWLLIYSAFIMMILRIFAIYPLTRVFSPLSILAFSSLLAVVGIFMLSYSTVGGMILIFATIYGVGQTFFWPCTLGVVSEQFPEGGALTINSIAGVGMLGVGIIGAPLLGNLQDTQKHEQLQQNAVIYEQFVGADAEEKTSIFGTYHAVDQEKVDTMKAKIKELQTARDDDDQSTAFGAQEAAALDELLGPMNEYDALTTEAKARALRFAAGPPVFMFLSYIGLILWFKAQGGYKPVELEG